MSNRYFVGDLSTLDTYDNANSVAEAHKVVDNILAKGGRPAVGAPMSRTDARMSKDEALVMLQLVASPSGPR